MEITNGLDARVIVVIPALNEEKTVGDVVRGCHQTLKGQFHEVVVVDGHSSDGTVKIAEQEGAKVVVQKGDGYGDALNSGFRYALRILRRVRESDIIVMMDADGTYPTESITDLIKPILCGKADLVIGNRLLSLDKEAMSRLNRVGNRFFSGLSRFLFNIRSLDTQSGYRAFRAKMLNHLIFKNPGMPLASEMIIEAKNSHYSIEQIPITYGRREGKSKLRPVRDGFLILGTFVRLYRDFSPLFFFGVIGGIISVIGGVSGFYLLARYLLTGLVPHYVLSIMSASVFLTGIIILTIGLLADMIKDLRERMKTFETQLMENYFNNHSEPTQFTEEVANEKNKDS